MSHYEATDKPSRYTPRRTPHVLKFTFGRLILRAKRLGEVLTEEMGRPQLKGLVVLHQGFARIGANRTGELLRLGLHARDRRHRHPLFHELAVELQNEQRLLHRFGFRRMCRVPFLPQELRGTEEQPRPHLPTHDVGPLIQENREIPVALDPLREHRVDDGLRRRPHNERLI